MYGLIALVLVLGQGGYYHSKPRLLVPVLLILVPPAIALGRARPRTAALVLSGCAAFGLWSGSLPDHRLALRDLTPLETDA